MASEPPSSRPEDTEPQSRETTESALDIARHQLKEAASFIDINANVLERLNYPAAVHEVTIPLKRDDGAVEMFRG